MREGAWPSAPVTERWRPPQSGRVIAEPRCPGDSETEKWRMMNERFTNNQDQLIWLTVQKHHMTTNRDVCITKITVYRLFALQTKPCFHC